MYCRFSKYAFLLATIAHGLMRILHGKGSLRHAFLAAAYVTLIFYPVHIAIVSISSRVTASTALSETISEMFMPSTNWEAYYLVVLLAFIYKVSGWKALHRPDVLQLVLQEMDKVRALNWYSRDRRLDQLPA